MPDVSDCSVSLQENSGQKLQVGQSFPIGLDADLPMYNGCGTSPFCRRHLATSRLDDCAARDAGLPVFKVGAAGVRSPSLLVLQSSNRRCTPCRPRSRSRQRITAFMIRLAGVPSNVYPRHCVVADQLFELLPKVLVDNRLP